MFVFYFFREILIAPLIRMGALVPLDCFLAKANHKLLSGNSSREKLRADPVLRDGGISQCRLLRLLVIKTALLSPALYSLEGRRGRTLLRFWVHFFIQHFRRSVSPSSRAGSVFF